MPAIKVLAFPAILFQGWPCFLACSIHMYSTALGNANCPNNDAYMYVYVHYNHQLLPTTSSGKAMCHQLTTPPNPPSCILREASLKTIHCTTVKQTFYVASSFLHKRVYLLYIRQWFEDMTNLLMQVQSFF